MLVSETYFFLCFVHFFLANFEQFSKNIDFSIWEKKCRTVSFQSIFQQSFISLAIGDLISHGYVWVPTFSNHIILNIGILCIRAASCKTQQEKITKQDKITQQENTFLGIKCVFLLS